MEDFRIVKNGYDRKQVDDYIFDMVQDNEKKFNEQKIRISDLKQQLEETRQQLNTFKEKNSNISDALVVAVETAKQIENSSKNIYELEIKRVRSLYDKWQKFLDDFMAKYPGLQNKYDTKMLLKVFANDIDAILKQNRKSIEEIKAIENDNLESNTISLKMLINKMSNVTKPNSNNVAETSNYAKEPVQKQHTIIRNAKPSEETLINHQIDMAISEETERLKKDMIKPIANTKMSKGDEYENLVDKFLRDDDDSYENNAYSKVFLEKEKNDGFDLKEAVNPTEALEDIMKSFSFYNGDDE